MAAFKIYTPKNFNTYFSCMYYTVTYQQPSDY